MELKDLLGADYKEGMTAEEIAAALTTKSFVSKDVFDKTASDLASLKKASKTHETDLASQLEAQRQQIEQLTISGNRHEARSAVFTVSDTVAVSPGFSSLVLANAFSSFSGLFIALLSGAAT